MADKLAVDPPWMSRIAEMAERGREIAQEMNKPEIASNGHLMAKLVREHGALEKILKPYRDYRYTTDQLNESYEILNDHDADPDLRELAEAEVEEQESKREKLLTHLQEKLVTGDEALITSVLVEIRAGTGGDEAALFARELMDMYKAYATRKALKLEVISITPTELGGIKECILNITGEECFLNLRFEAGGHRVQRVPETESQGRIHTSAATVVVMPEPEEVEVDINWDTDVLEHVSRAGGPGGQNVNKVSSAIKLEHIPTGITVSMRDEKSQHKNRAKARRIMMTRVYEHFRQQQEQELAAERKGMAGSGDRSERIRTYNFPQNRCTDHRIGMDQFGLEAILIAGELDPFHEALRDRDIKLRLENFAFTAE